MERKAIIQDIMKWERGELIYVKINNEFIQARMVKEVKKYHGSAYYDPNEKRYFVELRTLINDYSRLVTPTFSESDLIAWEREYKLHNLGI